jgi:type II secretion system protein G
MLNNTKKFSCQLSVLRSQIVRFRISDIRRTGNRKPITENRYSFGFTLIELLITISIIAVLTAISAFALNGARETARDSRRKTDLEQIKSSLEIYKADCNRYPTAAAFDAVAVNSSLTGSSCTPVNTNTYVQRMPGDPTGGGRYRYCPNASGTTYTLSTYQEDSTATVTACGSCSGGTCRYQVTNP